MSESRHAALRGEEVEFRIRGERERVRAAPSSSTSAAALFKHGVFEVSADNFKLLLLGQIKPRFERSSG